MAIPNKETPEDGNPKTSVSISGPAYMLAVNGASRSVRGKTRTYYISSSQKTSGEECRILSRYLKPPMGSCHDRCKHGIHESEEPRSHMGFGSRRRHIVKNKGVPRTHVVLIQRKKTTRRRPRPSHDPIIYAPAEPVKVSKPRKATRNALKTVKTHPNSAGLNGQNNRKDIKKITASKAARTGLLPPKPPKGSENRNRKLSLSPVKDQKVQESISEAKHETENVEIIQSPPIPTTDSTNLLEEEAVPLSSEASSELVDDVEVQSSCGKSELVDDVEVQSSCGKSELVDDVEVQSSCGKSELVDDVEVQSSCGKSELLDDVEVQSSCGKIILEECENSNNEEEGIIFEEDDDDDDDETETSEGKKGKSYRVVFCEDKDDDEDIKLRREKILEMLSEENGPCRLKFTKVVDQNGEQGIRKITFKKAVIREKEEEEEGEKVNLKHQEVEKKEVQELFNIIIEETASKLAGAKKTKVGALVGAFETVISLQDENPSSEDEKKQKPEVH